MFLILHFLYALPYAVSFALACSSLKEKKPFYLCRFILVILAIPQYVIADLVARSVMVRLVQHQWAVGAAEVIVLAIQLYIIYKLIDIFRCLISLLMKARLRLKRDE